MLDPRVQSFYRAAEHHACLDFKRAAVQRVVTGEKTVAELSRELDIGPSVIRSWKRFAEARAATAATAVHAHEDVVPASHLREAYAKIRELERALGRKTMEVEILRAAQEVVIRRQAFQELSGSNTSSRVPSCHAVFSSSAPASFHPARCAAASSGALLFSQVFLPFE